jgi:hypothetical protein
MESVPIRRIPVGFEVHNTQDVLCMLTEHTQSLLELTTLWGAADKAGGELPTYLPGRCSTRDSQSYSPVWYTIPSNMHDIHPNINSHIHQS